MNSDMEGVAKLFQDTEKGVVSIRKFSIDNKQAKAFNLRCLFNGDGEGMIVPGDYVRLTIGGTLYMSDTPMEQSTNREFIRKANGDVMIAGLGIGLIIHNLREAVQEGKVKSITIYEKFQDVIDLVAPIYADLPITYKCADILEYKPSREEKYDTIYFDIWPKVSCSNLPEMRLLANRWKFHLNRDNPNCWMDSWRKKKCQQLNRY